MAVKKNLGRAHMNPMTLPTIIAEVKATLNDSPLACISNDISDPH